MYLKTIELVGFKSFASKTKLHFEPGMTAIVGPNGCGKSNISDAIRWVLGEQSAKALRGSKMEDVIFNGTDDHKPLSMAEVSLSLADCESALGTEYDEVTITRRVLRSGEGQYFINKTACRLKDIQRLFMDTGIGTNSYSLMEQGRIDLILSSRPEDRRAVFEEASGITKFKADKKEAIRKLEQTEANLLRLADIIREVKRRIISLQRQAGKAKRYKELQNELRSLDIYLSREKLSTLTGQVEALESRLAHLLEQEEATRSGIQDTEQQAHELRAVVQQKEEEISQAMDAASRAASELDRARQTIQVNDDRILEMRELSERDSRDADDAQGRLQVHHESLGSLEQRWQDAVREHDEAELELGKSSERLKQLDASVEEIRQTLNRLRSESIDLDSRGSRLQNELSDLDAQERTSVLRRERLSAELSETKRSVEKFDNRRAEAEAHMEQLRNEVTRHQTAVAALQDEKGDVAAQLTEQRQALGDLQKRTAAREAQTELFTQADAEAEALPPGARRLLGTEGEPVGDRSRVLGTLAEHLQAPPAYQRALEAALRAWLDAVVVSDPQALLDTVRALEEGEAGSARLLSAVSDADIVALPADLPGTPLLQQVQASDPVKALAARLLHGVRVVDSLNDLSLPLHPQALFVTRSGAVVCGDGSGELWRPGAQETNPMTRRHLLAQWTSEIDALSEQAARVELTLQHLATRDTELDKALQEARTLLEESRRNQAICEGEHQVKAEEAEQARERMETVSYELNALVEQQASSGDRRTSITQEIEQVRNRQSELRHELATQTDALHAKEADRGEWLSEVTEKRVQLGERRQAVAQLAAQKEDLHVRMAELETLVQDRRKGLDSYHVRIEELHAQIEQTRNRLQPLEADVHRHNEALTAARRDREDNTIALRHLETTLHEKRAALDELRNQRSKLDVELAEQRMRLQNITERISQDYHITPEQMESEPDPQWEEGVQPDRETLETNIAEIRTKLESMGPVNLIAIEEHEELEERFQFLTEQQEDLIKGKAQLMDMIKRINNTTTEMFTRTFDKVNVNFQQTFKQLFGGGSAKLVLVDDEDVLESGIEIIARPPGKKLQTVSLLSGGERTMTAVALLFALYMVKPSPFCVLDELDAALDDSNISRFVGMVEGFVKHSQFVIITHNRQTIEAADALYGVTMEKFGISKIMSVRFHKHEEAPAKDDPQQEMALKPAGE